MSLNYSYMHAIGVGFPGIDCICQGSPDIYENIVWTGGNPLPEKSEIDTWITDKYKDDMWQLIKNERDRRKENSGYKVTVSGTDYWFHSDTFSRTQQIGLVILDVNLPNNIMWKTMSGAFILMTPTLAQQIFQAAMVTDTTIFAVAEQKKAEMLALENPQNYDYLSGWPVGYGE